MKTTFLHRARPLVLLLGMGLGWSHAAHAQRTREGANLSSPAQTTIEHRVRSFYAFWGDEANASKDALGHRALIRAYTSRRLARWLYSPAYRDFDADYFFQAQDFDRDWNEARVRDVRVEGSTARLLVTLGHPKPSSQGIGERKLRLKMVKENGVWKIDRVDVVEH